MSQERQGSPVWGILLAGGDGTRLQSLTTEIEGDTRPKQFCRILGDQTLLTQTLSRISPLLPADKVIAVVTKRNELFYSPALNDWPQTAVIAQPENRGTGVAIAAAILTLRDLDCESIVAVFPCDHNYRNEAVFTEAVEAAIGVARNNSEAIVLIGSHATYPETEYGWIEPGQKLANGARFEPTRVRQLWDKPTAVIAQDLLQRGCLRSTFVTIGRVGAFLDILCQAVPKVMLTLSEGILENDLDLSYRFIPSIDFCRDVLAFQPEHLIVIRDAMSKRTDLRNPQSSVRHACA